MKDKELITQIKKGDEKALDYIYHKNFKSIIKMVLNNKGTEDEAQDIYQDALIVLWQKVQKDDFVLTSKLSTYLYAICKNLWLRELERKSRLVGIEKDEVEFINLEQKERIKIIHDCIDSLGDTCKKVLTYYYFDGMSMLEIAKKLGFANADTAKSKKYKCKKELDSLIKSKYKATDFLD
jgi:RNA polymerase sigma factor (sigma-70 family)